MRIVINSFEEQADGTILVEFQDPGQRITAYFHITEQAIDDLIVGMRNPNRSPTNLLDDTKAGLGNLPAAAVVQLWATAYSELVQDRLDRKTFNMKAVTSHGHADLEAVRAGGKVNEHNKARGTSTAMDDFIKGRSNAN